MTFKTTTGFGYIEDASGNIVDKCHFEVFYDEAGSPVEIEHPIKDGYTFREVADLAALNAVQVYQPPPTQEYMNMTLKFQISTLEASLARALREVMRGIADPTWAATNATTIATAQDRIKMVDAQITTLRAQIK